MLNNISWNLLNELLSRGALFIATLYLSRHLGVESFGIYMFVLAVINQLWSFSDLGTTMYGIREVSTNKNILYKVICPILVVRIFSSFVVYILLLVYINLYIKDELHFFLLAIGGCFLLIKSIYLDWFYKGAEKFKILAISSSIYFIVYLFVLLFFIDKVSSAVMAWSAINIVPAIVLIFFLKREIGAPLVFSMELKQYYKIIKKSFFFGLSAMTLMLAYQVPIFILRFMDDNYQLGIFSAPYRVVQMAMGFAFTIIMSIYPSLSYTYKNDFSKFKKLSKFMTKILVLSGVGIGVLGMLFSKEVVYYLFGSEYKDSAIIFFYIMVFIPLYYFRNSIAIILHATGNTKYHNISCIYGLIVSVFTGAVLISNYGGVGAVVSLLACEFTIILSMLYFKRRLVL